MSSLAGTPCHSWSRQDGLDRRDRGARDDRLSRPVLLRSLRVSLKRIAYALAEELAPLECRLAITPGFMRTEAILEKFGVTEANWRDTAEKNAQAKRFGFIHSETPCFVGRAVAALAADPKVARWSGGVYSSWGLSECTASRTWMDAAQYLACRRRTCLRPGQSRRCSRPVAARPGARLTTRDWVRRAVVSSPHCCRDELPMCDPSSG